MAVTCSLLITRLCSTDRQAPPVTSKIMCHGGDLNVGGGSNDGENVPNTQLVYVCLEDTLRCEKDQGL